MLSIQQLILNDPQRCALLHAAAAMQLPDWFLAAGFVRNCVWDALHGFTPTKLNDIDLIFYDSSNQYDDDALSQQLTLHHPGVRWQVKMHLKNGDKPYQSSLHAMTFWPEKETAIGVRLSPKGQMVIAAPFGITSLLRGEITPNPARERSLCLERDKAKQWLQRWPKLRIR